MKRGAGLLAMFTFILTGLHFASGPAASKTPSEVASASAVVPVAKIPAPIDTTCDAFIPTAPAKEKAGDAEQNPNDKGEIAALIDRYLYGPSRMSHVAPGILPAGVRLMIATVPDPLHTHLNLQFDRTLEAIQQAAQDEKYTYDSSWLPWRTKSVEYTSIADRNAEAREAAQREVCPGVILFRRSMMRQKPDDCTVSSAVAPELPYQCGMLVFVVAEKPTSGLNRVQWDNAIHWIDAHASPTRKDKVLRILGPNFSGSMPSFARALEDPDMLAGTFNSILLYAGRIRGCSSWHWLKSELDPETSTQNPPRPHGTLPVRIADFEENESLQTDRFYKYLGDRGHRLSEVAVLSEDETAYGGLPDTAPRSVGQEAPPTEPSPCSPEYLLSRDYLEKNEKPVHLYYPRDISAIRSAYQEQSIFSAGTRTDSSTTPHTVLRPESDPSAHNDTDTVEPFSGNNLALTQEAQMYGIVNTLKTHGIRYVILRSTNSLDYLFLTRFLHRAYPTAYIVTMGSDLLFAREVDSTEFRGVVALSTFPLLPRGQDWTKQVADVPQHAHRVFGSYTMEGDYLAARFLIKEPGLPSDSSKNSHSIQRPAEVDIPDYAPPFWDSPNGEGETSEPVTWLSVVGRDGYWPLAILKEPRSDPRSSNLAVVHRPPPQNSVSAPPRYPKEKLTLSISWRLCCVFALLGVAVHFFACRFGWERQDFGMFVQFTPLKGKRGPALIAAGWSAICALLLILFLASFRIYQWLGLMDRIWVLATGGATITALVMATLQLRWWNKPIITATPVNRSAAEDRRARNILNEKPHFSAIWIVLMFTVVGLFGLAGWLTFDYNGSDSSGVTTAYRSVHLTSGVSPVVSLIVMLAGFYWWFWQSLSGFALLGNGRPVLPRRDRIPPGLSQVSDRLAQSIEATALPLPHFGSKTLLLYSLPLFLVVLIAFVLQRASAQAFDLILHSLENSAFNNALHVLIAIALYLILLESAQFYATWLALQRLLQALNRLPLRRTFAAIQGLSMRSLWRLSGTSSRARYKIFSHQLESLLHLCNELDAFESRECATPSIRRAARVASARGSRFVADRSQGPDLAMVNCYEAYATRIRFCACAEILLRRLLAPEWHSERIPLDLREAPVEGKADEQMTLSEKMPIRLAEEFVCMIYVGYLQNLLGRMRTMVLSVAGIFAAIALSVGFYPFTPRPTISLSLMALLIFIGTVVGVVYAGLDRDSTLSHITNTESGSLGAHFWFRIVSFIGVPAMGLIVAQFPEITDFVISWIQPTMNAVK